MKEIISILEKWSEFQTSHPKGDFEDFCRYYLAKSRSARIGRQKVKERLPIDLNGKVARAVSRTHLSLWLYMRIALKNTPFTSIEQFMFSAALFALGESRKSDVINYAMMEISTGTDILNRLIEKGFVHERVDPDDKRSRLLTLTRAGRSVLMKCFKTSSKVRQILFGDLTDEDKQLLVYLLDPVHEKHARLAVESKNKTIEAIHAGLFAGKKL
ncbi:MAG TPA: hypothetical protein VF490_01200 [Chryseosolibacter sp.]